MWMNGIVDNAALKASATLCIVLVHSPRHLGADRLERGCLAREALSCSVPVAFALQLLDLGEVNRAQYAVGGVKAAAPVATWFR